MAKRGFLSMLAVPVAGSALLGGLPGTAAAVTTAPATAPARAAGAPGGPLTPALASRLARNVDKPVIVILKNQARQPGAAGPAVSASATASAAATSALTSLQSELKQVHAAGIKRFSLVNSIAATVSLLEEQRLAADPAVARVIPDETITVPAPAPPASVSPGAASSGQVRQAAPARPASLPLHAVPGACAARNTSQLAPEGLALTGTASGNAKAVTARSLGFTGAGVKVAYIADGLDPANANFKRPNGTSVFAGYQDFTGNGPNAPTAGGEAFLDASTIAGQGTQVYNVNGFSAQSYAGTTCDVRIEGVAPGASLVGLDVFSGDQGDLLATTTSMFAQAIDYAVETAKVNVLNESFGGNPLPDTTQDVIKMFDDAAVRAGVVVSVSSGDAGTANTIDSPASDPAVISAGATTQFQALAQANIGGTRYFATRGWLSDNISSFSSSGFDEEGGTVDLVAPGDLSWASCDPDAARYSDCTSDTGHPSAMEEAGGTSEAAPFVSGAAALVIQAYRKRHGGATPSPALVKQILLSTAADLGAPAQEQGAGLLNSYHAVQLAESYGTPGRTGQTVLASAGQLTGSALPGAARSWTVSVTNEGARAQTVTMDTRSLNPASTSSASGTVTLSDSASDQYTADSGAKANYATFTFRVPAGQGRLDVSIAYPGSTAMVSQPVSVALFDPDGRVAADSEPQGVADYGSAEVRAPVAGVWTAVVSGYPASAGGYNGTVTWQESTQKFTSFGTVSPASMSLAPGQAGSFTVTAPSAPGDQAGAVLLHSLSGVTTIPAVLRTLVDVASGGAFSGVLTGGNGRGALGTDDYYQFSVPAGTTALRAELALRDNPGTGNVVGAYLVAPDGDVQGYGQNFDLSGAAAGRSNPDLTATALNPAAGRWTLVVAFAEPVTGTEVADPFSGNIAFAPAAAAAPATPLPDGTTLTAGTAVTIPVKITNESNAPQDYYLDPRLDTTATVTLAPFVFGVNAPFDAGSRTAAMPLPAGAAPSLYFVPSGTTAVRVTQTSTVPAMTDLATYTGGDPDVGLPGRLTTGSLCATSVSETYAPAGAPVTSGAWTPAPTECGPFTAAAPKGTATDTLTVTTAAFDPSVTSATGDLERLAQAVAAGSAAIKHAVEIPPGRSATVTVTFKPSGAAGTAVSGTLYLDTVQSGVPAYGQLSGDEVAALPYSYVVG